MDDEVAGQLLCQHFVSKSPSSRIAVNLGESTFAGFNALERTPTHTFETPHQSRNMAPPVASDWHDRPPHPYQLSGVGRWSPQSALNRRTSRAPAGATREGGARGGDEPRRSRGTMRRAMSSPSTAPTGGSASRRTTSGASSASTTGAARCCSTAARTAWCTGSPPRSAGAAAAPRSTLAEGIELCAGDRIRWTRNDGGLCLVNSRTAEVTAANDGRVTFRLEDGRTLDMNAGDPQLRHIDRAGPRPCTRSRGGRSIT